MSEQKATILLIEDEQPLLRFLRVTLAWGPGASDELHYLRVYVNQLRQKVESDSARPRYLMTEPGVGYRLASELSDAPI